MTASAGAPLDLHPAVRQHHDPVRDAGGGLQIVQHHHHHRPILACIVAGQAKHLQLMPQVQGAGRFVQQQDARLADHGLGQARDLALAARQPVQTLQRQIDRPDPLQRRQGADFGLGRTGGGRRGLQRRDHRFQHCQGHVLRQGLGHIGDMARPLGDGQSVQVQPVQHDPTHSRRQARDGAHQGGLARPVRTDQRHDLACRQRLQVHVRQDGPLAVAGGQMLDDQAHPRAPLRKIRIRKAGTPITAVTTPTGNNAPGTMTLDAADARDIKSAPLSTLAGR